MCEFCKLEKLESCKALARENVDGGKIAKNMDIELWYIKTDDGDNYICADLSDKGGVIAAEAKTQIKFCPVCGREL